MKVNKDESPEETPAKHPFIEKEETAESVLLMRAKNAISLTLRAFIKVKDIKAEAEEKIIEAMNEAITTNPAFFLQQITFKKYEGTIPQSFGVTKARAEQIDFVVGKLIKDNKTPLEILAHVRDNMNLTPAEYISFVYLFGFFVGINQRQQQAIVMTPPGSGKLLGLDGKPLQ